MATLGFDAEVPRADSKNLKWNHGEAKVLCVVDSTLESIRVHNDQVKKRYQICGQESGGVCQFCKTDEPRFKLGINAVEYIADPATGTFTYKVKPWIMNPDIFKRLKELKAVAGGNLGSRDIIVKCTDGQYQRLELDLDESTPQARWNQIPNFAAEYAELSCPVREFMIQKYTPRDGGQSKGGGALPAGFGGTATPPAFVPATTGQAVPATTQVESSPATQPPATVPAVAPAAQGDVAPVSTQSPAAQPADATPASQPVTPPGQLGSGEIDSLLDSL